MSRGAGCLRWRHLLGAWAVLLAGFASGPSAHTRPTASDQQDPQRRTFRGGITLVPVDVRVLDATGQPVTDLTRADFRIFEDGVEQEIQQFAAVGLRPGSTQVATTPAETGAAGDRAKAAVASLEPENRRTFLIVLGRGRHTGPVRPFRALERFVRRQLLPQDQVAVIGYNRATDFTTDHEAIAATIERYRQGHEEIEALIAQNQNVMPIFARPEEMPEFVQRRIDAIFGRESLALAGEQAAGRTADEVRRTGEDLQRLPGADAQAQRPGELSVATHPSLANISFEQYVNQAFASLNDLANVHTGLDYLRYVEGEKHLVLFTVRGLALHDTTDEDHLAALAADARVTLDFIHTGGMVAAPPAHSLGMLPLPTPTQVFNQTFAVRAIRAMADLTGGQAWAFEHGHEALDQLDRSTRFRYVLGYIPADADPDDRYRRIRIDVSRPGLTVLYRRGYYASEARRETDAADVRTLARVRQASGFMVDLDDIEVELDASVDRAAENEVAVVAEITIDPAAFDFPVRDRMRVGIVDVAVFVGNERQQIIAEAWQKREWTLSEDGFARLREEPIGETIRVPVREEPRFVKVVVYERGADLLGTAIVRVQ